MAKQSQPADEQPDRGRRRSALSNSTDLLAVATGAAMTLAAITILTAWPWALLAAGLALLALGTVVI